MDKEYFKSRLKQLGITQLELSNKLGITNQQVTNWNKKGNYPLYLEIFFENENNKKKIKLLEQKIKELYELKI